MVGLHFNMKNNFYKNALTRTPPASMANGITSQPEVIDFEKAKQQHQAYIKNLEMLGLQVITLPAEERFPDSHFVEDTTIVYKDLAILTSPGAPTRRGEVECIRNHLKQLFTVEELGGDDNTFLDGGDVLFVGNKVLIGVYERTNYAGAKRLKSILQTINENLEIHIIEFSGVLHLKSGLTALNESLVLASPFFKTTNHLDFINIHWLPENEAYAANTLTINGHTFHFEDAFTTKSIIESVGNKSVPFDLSEFKKMDGSFTCLSLLW